MGQPRVIQQTAERLQPDTALTDVLMTIELRSPGRLGIITVPHADIVQTHGFVQALQCTLQSLRVHNVVTGDMPSTAR